MAPKLRPHKDEIFMSIAVTWSALSTCSDRIAVGAVLVNSDDRVIASGYNGSPKGFPHCDDVGCDDDGHHHRVIHAEENVIIQCAITGISCKGSTMYITHPPCVRCALRLVQAGITEVIYLKEYGDVAEKASAILSVAGINLRRL